MDSHELNLCQSVQSVFPLSIRVYSCSFVVKSKNPTAGWQWGSVNLVMQSEPDCRAAQQQHIQQQVQIQIAVHV